MRQLCPRPPDVLDGLQVRRLSQLSIRQEEPMPKHRTHQEERRGQGGRISACSQQQKTQKIKLNVEDFAIV